LLSRVHHQCSRRVHAEGEANRPELQECPEPPVSRAGGGVAWRCMLSAPFLVELRTDGPIAAAAIHDGHVLRPDVAASIALNDAERLREEDPFTARWTALAGTRFIGVRSRFEVDLNRPREKAVYRVPEDAWGLNVWRAPPPPSLIEGSLEIYDAFHDAVHTALLALHERFGRFLVLDLHSYNHRREGANAEPADPDLNPEVNIGTGSMNREQWAPVVDRFMRDLRAADYLGRSLDVRENIKFRGGNFAAWVHRRFPTSGCAMAIEFRKFFMDEWTGIPDEVQVNAIGRALASTVPGLLESLGAVS
jgi:N-formylglutamate deformylase